MLVKSLFFKVVHKETSNKNIKGLSMQVIPGEVEGARHPQLVKKVPKEAI